MMPASGSANTTRLVRLVPLTEFPAHAVLLTSTTNAIVPTQTSRFDHPCDTPHLPPPHPPRADYELSLTLVLLRRVDAERQRRLVVVAVEGPRLLRVDPLELAVHDLHADQARAADLAADVDSRRRHAVGVEVVHVADRREQV